MGLIVSWPMNYIILHIAILKKYFDDDLYIIKEYSPQIVISFHVFSVSILFNKRLLFLWRYLPHSCRGGSTCAQKACLLLILPLDEKEEVTSILTAFYKTRCHKYHIMIYKMRWMLLKNRVDLSKYSHNTGIASKNIIPSHKYNVWHVC